MKLVWTEEAIRDLTKARSHIGKDNPRAAAELAGKILRAAEKLLEHPQLGRKGRLAGTRELVIAGTPYVIPYRIHGDRLDLLRVLHGRQQYP